MKLYLDACCFNRPFDDQGQLRIRLESEAVIEILNRCKKRDWQLFGSEVIDFEISLTQDEARKERVSILTAMFFHKIAIDQKIVNRAIELLGLKLKPFDAFHVACAENGEVDVFLTTDDELLQKGIHKKLRIRVDNPLKWLMEVIADEKSNNEPR